MISINHEKERSCQVVSTQAVIFGFKKSQMDQLHYIEHILVFKMFKESVELSVYQNLMLFSLGFQNRNRHIIKPKT